MKSTIIYLPKLPSVNEFPAETILLYDAVLAKNLDFKKWAAQFNFHISLKAGENLKTLDSLNFVLKKISKMNMSKSTKLTFLGVGGGSVGDFVGFLSSIYMRGRNLVLIPSTWLAAVDSAHGGKNALNILKAKNQIGTFHSANKIYICKNLLLTQPQDRLTESLGEIIKISILADKKLFKFLQEKVNKINGELILQKLPTIIKLKYKIVNSDPFEKKGYRRLLNLGHTMGHVFESALGYPHGVAVLIGLQFALRWSFNLNLLTEKDFFEISNLIEALNIKQNLNNTLKQVSNVKIQKLLLQDKKQTLTKQLDFIFIKSVGQCFKKSVFVSEIMNEVKRQRLEY
jgi:3-dehydroquinate synthetase